MKASDIILHLIQELPKYTDKFSEKFTVDSASISGATVTIGKTAHGLITGNIISVVGGAFLNPISDIDDSGEGVLMTTANSHDLTGQEAGVYEVYLSSVTDSSVDGLYTLEGTIDRLQFLVPTFPDTGLTDVILSEFREVGIDGLYSVTVINADTFTYELSDDPEVTMDITTDTEIKHSFRISGASTIQRCVSAYEQQTAGKLWGFVVLGENAVSKSRAAQSDIDTEQGGLNYWDAQYLSPFVLYVFSPVAGTTALSERDDMEDLRPHLFRSLLGARFDSGFKYSEGTSTIPVSDGVNLYQEKFYVHEFSFQQMSSISQVDTYQGSPTRAWNDLHIDFINTATDNGEVIAAADIKMDEKS